MALTDEAIRQMVLPGWWLRRRPKIDEVEGARKIIDMFLEDCIATRLADNKIKNTRNKGNSKNNRNNEKKTRNEDKKKQKVKVKIKRRIQILLNDKHSTRSSMKLNHQQAQAPKEDRHDFLD